MPFDGATRLGVLCLTAYVAVAWSMRFDTREGPHNASVSYPFDTFSMYAEVLPDRASAAVIRLDDGTTESVTAFSALDCSRQPATDGRPAGPPIGVIGDDGGLDEGLCAPPVGLSIEYLDEDLASYLRSHRGTGPITVELVRRTWLIPPNGATRASDDCVIATCRVAR